MRFIGSTHTLLFERLKLHARVTPIQNVVSIVQSNSVASIMQLKKHRVSLLAAFVNEMKTSCMLHASETASQ